MTGSVPEHRDISTGARDTERANADQEREKAWRHRDDPPGAVSNQNQEENVSALRDDGEHPEPRSRD
ncbi:MAG TPA: hypothetical protein VME01_11320 [Solirubrobacteraceae bacterium]|nr:hypothetical protein [Solirubrobacteraceae bacterium]